MNCDNASLLLYAVTDRSWLHGQTLYEQAEQALQGGATFCSCVKRNSTRRIFKRRPSRSRHCANSTACRSCSMTTWRSPWPRTPTACTSARATWRLNKVRALIGPDKILGVSAQTVEEALLAEREGADYLGVGAVFPTGTKADANAVSYDTLRDICAAVSIPVIAIGGITKDNVARLSGSGIVGVAVVSAIFAQPDIPAATRELKAAVRTALDL